jgi:hypothetical protein
MSRTRTRILSTVFATAAGTAALVAVLSACAGGDAGPTASPTTSASVSSSPSQSPSPTPTETIAPAVLPTDCNDLGTPESRQEAVGDMTLQSDGVGFVRPAPENATLALGCDWIVGDATGMLLLISTATPDEVATAVTTLPGLGYTCQVSDDFGADFCELPGANADTEEMIVARDDVWIYLSTANRSGRAFLSDIAQQIWG